ncbi:MAG TPA: YfhO family protein, partial [Saprospiraceae bacterium]|nr:YfhO family protein [Saprospiraceae bacterium]
RSSAPSDQIAVFSEIYYGPNKGWQAYIDGVKAPHFRANYALRAMNVPQGDHEIKFRFEPKSYKIGEMLSLIFSILIILILIFGLYKWLTKAEPTAPVAIADLSNKHATSTSQPERKLLRKKKK